MKKANSHTSISSVTIFIVLFQFLMNIVVFLDVVFVRQIVGLIYLTFIPGFVIVKMLKLDEVDFSEIILFSVGLSIALLMFIGLFVNELCPLIGITRPLSTLPLLLALNLFVLLPCFLGYLRDARIPISSEDLSYSVLLFICLPLLSILGVFLVNNFGDNSLLLLMIIVIAGSIAFGAIHRKWLPIKVYPLALLAITMALLFHTSLVTNYIVGWDIHSEYHAFTFIKDVAHWDVRFHSWDERIARANAMLSTTVLPTIYSTIVNMDGTWIFKVLYPLILSFVPLALYRMYSGQMKEKAAFLSVFFFVSNFVFFRLFATKQMVSELFYVLLFLVVLKEKMGPLKRNFLFVIFGAGLVVSHYATSYLFLFFILITWLYNFASRRARVNIRITESKILIFFVMAFAWYIFTSTAAPFDAIVTTADHISGNIFSEFFNPEARGSLVLTGIGLGEAAASIQHQIGRIFFYITEFFIIVGFAKLVLKKKDTNFSHEYRVLASLNMVILAMCIVLPNFAEAFRMERFYQVSLLILAPLCVLGGETIFRRVLKRKNDVLALNLILVVLIPFFLFETAFIYEVTGDVSYSLPLSMYRMDNFMLSESITDEREVSGAQWLLMHQNVSDQLIYADLTAVSKVLTSYGMTSMQNLRVLSNTTVVPPDNAEEWMLENMAYIYLRPINVLEGEMKAWGYVWNTSAISPLLDNQNKVYSNGACEIYASQRKD